LRLWTRNSMASSSRSSFSRKNSVVMHVSRRAIPPQRPLDTGHDKIPQGKGGANGKEPSRVRLKLVYSLPWIQSIFDLIKIPELLDKARTLRYTGIERDGGGRQGRMSGHSILVPIWKRTLRNPHLYLSSRGHKMALLW